MRPHRPKSFRPAPGKVDFTTFARTVVSGVYILTCTATGEIYVGGSIDIGRRCRQHKHAMRHGKHTSTKMQQRWNEYPESFAYTVLLVCEPDQILQREQDLVDRFQPELNTAPYSYSNAAMKMTAAQREAMKHRPQSIAKKHPLRGEMLTVPQIAERVGVSVPCIRARMREGRDLGSPSQKGVPVPMEIDGEWLTPRQIADRFALPLTTVYSRLSRGWTGERLTEPRKHRGRFSL